MDGWTKEVILAVRGLLRRPGFTAVAVVTLAMGIGANSAIFSVVNGVILEPLRYPESEELVILTSAFPTMNFTEFWISPPEYMQVSEQMRSFESIGAFTTFQSSVGADEQPERVNSARTSHQLFEALGVAPEFGRYGPRSSRRGGTGRTDPLRSKVGRRVRISAGHPVRLRHGRRPASHQCRSGDP